MGDVLNLLRRQSSGFKPNLGSVTIHDNSVSDGDADVLTTTGYNTTLESISDSEDSDSDDLDPLAMLSGSKVSKSINTLATKRAAHFENDRKSGIKRLKPPPKTMAPFLRKNDGSLLKKSAELQKLHAEDEQEAIKSLEQEITPRKEIIRSLDNKAARDTEYVDFLENNKDELQLNDFFYIGEAPYIKPIQISDPIELFMIPGLIRQENINEFDIFNEVHEDIILKEIDKIGPCELKKDEIVTFMHNIGASRNLTEQDTITTDDLKMDSKGIDIDLIIAKFHYLVIKVVNSSYDKDKLDTIVKIIGFFIMDKRVFNSGNSILFSKLINFLLEWEYKATGEVDLRSIVNRWNSLSNVLILKRRIIETLSSEVSMVISQLRRLLALDIFSQGKTKDLKFLENPVEFNTQIYSQAYQHLVGWNKYGKEFFHDCDYGDIKIEFQCLLQCLNFDDIQNKELDQIKNEINKLRNKVSTSFQNSEQASYKSLLLLISTVLQDQHGDYDSKSIL